MHLYTICIFQLTLFVYIINCHESHNRNGVPLNHAGGHDHHNGNEQVKANINVDHVLEHLDGVINKPKDQMTLEEQNFYYFKLHDYDNNNKLDGLELVSAFAHNEEHKDEDHVKLENNTEKEDHHQSRISDEDLIKVIDEIMKDEDSDNDGYITYQEFVQAINRSS